MALTIGMTYQVSDTDLTTKAIRRADMRAEIRRFGDLVTGGLNLLLK